MTYCLNPNCPNPTDPLNDNFRYCSHCGSDLLFGERYRVFQKLSSNHYEKTFEVGDGSTSKILKLLQIDDPIAITLFQQQALLLGQLDCPGVPKIERGGYFSFLPHDSKTPLQGLLMEKIEGLNLEEWLENRDRVPISQPEAIAWLKQILEILQVIHQLPYLHLNIKPSNIVLTPSGQLVLIDFGASRQVFASYLRSQELPPTLQLNSPGYTPPEQLKHEAVMRSDFFALGRTIVYLLTATHPRSLCKSETSEFCWRDRAAQISEPFADLLDRLMEASLNQRPENATAILQELAQLESAMMQPELLTTASTAVTPSSETEVPTPISAIATPIKMPILPELPPLASPATAPRPLPFKVSKKTLRLSKAFAIWSLIGFAGGIGVLLFTINSSRIYQCKQLMSAIDKGGKEVSHMEGTDAESANKLAKHLDKLAKDLSNMNVSDATLQVFPNQLGKNYKQLSTSFYEIGEAIAIVDAAPLSKAGLDEVKAARKKAEEAGKAATIAAKNADEVALKVHSYCLK